MNRLMNSIRRHLLAAVLTAFCVAGLSPSARADFPEANPVVAVPVADWHEVTPAATSDHGGLNPLLALFIAWIAILAVLSVVAIREQRQMGRSVQIRSSATGASSKRLAANEDGMPLLN